MTTMVVEPLLWDHRRVMVLLGIVVLLFVLALMLLVMALKHGVWSLQEDDIAFVMFLVMVS